MKRKIKLMLISLFISQSVYAEVGKFSVPPDFEASMGNRYEGTTLRDQLTNAGVRFEEGDWIRMVKDSGVMLIETSDDNFNLIQNLINEMLQVTPRYASEQIVKELLAKRVWDFRSVQYLGSGSVGVRSLGFIEFNDGGVAKRQSDIGRETMYKWAVRKDGTIELRTKNGDLIITGSMDATGRINVINKDVLKLEISSKEP